MLGKMAVLKKPIKHVIVSSSKITTMQNNFVLLIVVAISTYMYKSDIV